MLPLIKNIIKRMLPPSWKNFNLRLDSVDQKLMDLFRQQDVFFKYIKELNEKNEKNAQILVGCLKEIKELKVRFEKNSNTNNKFQNDTKMRVERIEKRTTEVLWAEIFNNTVSGSLWLKDRAFSPGRWAIGYPFLYVLYRILNEMKPRYILELGLGQSTRMIAQYAFSAQANHEVIEHDEKWISFFCNEFELSDYSQILKLDLIEKQFIDDMVIAYKDFYNQLLNRKFDFICIDGPYGYMAQKYSRIDVLDIIPKSLTDSFVIIIDDYNREGEKNMVEALMHKLESANILFKTKTYGGEKTLCVIASNDLSFLCSL